MPPARGVFISISALALCACGGDEAPSVPQPPVATGTPTPTPTPTPVLQTEADIEYANGQLLDLFVPDTDPRRTALIFVHGGGFTQGDKADLNGLADLYSDGGFITASINYRLAPANPAPVPEQDVGEAVAWVQSGGGGRGIATDRVVLIGYSAGATLAVLAALNDKPSVDAVVAVAGVYDFEAAAASTTIPRLQQDIADYTANLGLAGASAIRRDLSGAAPMFLIHGLQDNVVPVEQSVAMASALDAAGNNLLLKTFPNTDHDILLASNPGLQEVLDDITAYVVAVDAE